MNFTDKEFNEAIARHRQDERDSARWAMVTVAALAFIAGCGLTTFVLVLFNLEGI